MDLKPRHLNHKYLKGHFSISSFRSYVFYQKPSRIQDIFPLLFNGYYLIEDTKASVHLSINYRRMENQVIPSNGKSYHGGLFWRNFALGHDCMCLCLTPYNLMMYVKGHGMSYFDSLYCIKRFQFDKLMSQKILQLNMKVCPIDDGKPRCIYTTKIFFHQYFGVGMETSLLAFYTYCIDRPEYWLLNASIEAWKPHTSQDYECKIKNDVSGSGTCI